MTAPELARALRGKKSGAGWSACCPAHRDQKPSLSINEHNGKLLVCCHSGCSQEAVIAVLKARGLWSESERNDSDTDIEATYDYTDAAGVLLYQIVRKRGKKFLQRRPDGAGGWIWKKHKNQVLYHLPEVLESSIIFAVEGEKDVEALRSYGFCATTVAGGCKAPWLDSYTEALRGKEVVLVPDNDPPGRQRVREIVAALTGKVARLVVLTLEGPGVKDVSDWFAAGHSELELIAQLDPEVMAS